MGFMTKVWQNRGRGEKSRGHNPIEVRIYSSKAGKWAKERECVLEITAYRGKEFQQIDLTREEADTIAELGLQVCSDEKRAELICSELQKMSDARLLSILSSVMKSRPKSRDA